MTGRAVLLAALVLAVIIVPMALRAVTRRRQPPRRRREYPPLNPHVPMPPGAGLAVPHGQCGCELVWRPCQVHDPGWPERMERMVRQ